MCRFTLQLKLQRQPAPRRPPTDEHTQRARNAAPARGPHAAPVRYNHLGASSACGRVKQGRRWVWRLEPVMGLPCALGGGVRWAGCQLWQHGCQRWRGQRDDIKHDGVQHGGGISTEWGRLYTARSREQREIGGSPCGGPSSTRRRSTARGFASRPRPVRKNQPAVTWAWLP